MRDVIAFILGNFTLTFFVAGLLASAIALSDINQSLLVTHGGNVTINAHQSVSDGSAIELDGGTLSDTYGITVGPGGFLQGYGTVNADLGDVTGAVIAFGGTFTLAGSIAGGGEVDLHGRPVAQ